MPKKRLPPWQHGAVTVNELSGRFRARLSYRDGGGVAHTISATASTASGAEAQVLHRFRIKVLQSYVPVLSTDTVETLSRVWIDRRERQLTDERTLDGYRRTIRNFIVPDIGAVELASLTSGMLNNYIHLLRGDRSYAIARGAKTVLNQMLADAALDGAIAYNWMRDVRPMKKPEPFKVEYAPDQMRIVLAMMKDPALGGDYRRSGPTPDTQLISDLVVLCLRTSMRPGEMLALRRQDVTFEADGSAWVNVQGTVSWSTARGVFRKDSPKRERQRRRIRVTSAAVEVLARLVSGYIPNANELLFLTRDGTPVSVRQADVQLQRFRERRRAVLTEIGIEVDQFCYRSIRKSVASALARTVGEEAAKLTLGHSDVRTTRHHYIKTTPEVPPGIADVLASIFPIDRQAE